LPLLVSYFIAFGDCHARASIRFYPDYIGLSCFKTDPNLPIFYTFVVLLVGEHFFGVWGLICGVPVFTFLLDILGVKRHNEPLPPAKPDTKTFKY
jgi:hypothetical protein